MKTSAFVCTVLAGTLGLSGLASAQERGHRDRDGDGRRWEHRNDDRRGEWRRDRDHDRRGEWRRDDHRGRHHDGYRQSWNQPRYQVQQPRYYSHAPRYHRGGYLPHQYRHSNYYVSNWNAYPGLYAPPYGHQWVNVGGGELLLVALATGLIANAIIN